MFTFMFMLRVFKTFGDVHHLTSSLEATKRLAKELVEDAVTDGVIYTEVRTTPKAFTEPEASRRDYLDAVCSTIASTCAASKKFVRAGVLVSVNRGNSVDDAEDAVNLAYEFSTKKFLFYFILFYFILFYFICIIRLFFFLLFFFFFFFFFSYCFLLFLLFLLSSSSCFLSSFILLFCVTFSLSYIDYVQKSYRCWIRTLRGSFQERLLFLCASLSQSTFSRYSNINPLCGVQHQGRRDGRNARH